MINRSILVVALALVLPAIGAEAQTITSPYDFVEPSQSIWVFGGAVYTDRGSLDIGPGSGYGGGLGYSIRISGPFNFDGRLALLPTSRDVFDIVEDVDSATVRQDPTAAVTPIGTADLTLLIVDASLRFDITGPRTWYNLQPYALIGAGGVLGVSSDNTVEENLPDREGVDLFVRFSDGFTGHVGGGVEWYVTDRFSLRLDARDVLWTVNVPSGFFTTGLVIGDEQWVQTAHVNLGLAVRF